MARVRMPLVINAVDFTTYTNKNAYTVGYQDRLGPNNGFMIDGTETVDLRDRKAVIQWPLNALPSDKLAQLLTVCNDKYVAVKFFDTRINKERTAVFIPNISSGRFLFQSPHSGVKWFSGQVLNLRER